MKTELLTAGWLANVRRSATREKLDNAAISKGMPKPDAERLEKSGKLGVEKLENVTRQAVE